MDNYNFENFENITIFHDVNLNEISDHSDEEFLQPSKVMDFDYSDLNIEEIMEAVGKEMFIAEQVVPVDEVLPVIEVPVINEPVFDVQCQESSDSEYEQETDDISETSDDEYVPERKSVPRKRISKKPLKYSTDEYTSESEPEENTTTANKRTQNRKSPNIAHWLLKLIEQKSSAIGWTGRDREFKILDQKKLAKMWGERKGNNRMTYNNVA